MTPSQSSGTAPRSELSGVVHRNIEALLEVRRQADRRKPRQTRIADAITRFAGRMVFVYVHVILYGGWIALNSRVVPAIQPWDPFPFVMLAMIASVEAIFLSTFILISQNRMAEMADRRDDLDLQINLLSEHEVTRAIQLLDGIARHLGVPAPGNDVEELKRDVNPAQVMEQIERAENSPPGRGGT